MFSKSAPVRAPYPGNHQPLPSEPYLTTVVLESMRLFRSVDGNHTWTMGQNHDPKLLSTPDNRNILALKCPTNLTDWQITPYLFPISSSSEEDEEGEENKEDDNDEDGDEEPRNLPSTGGASSSHDIGHPTYHQQYTD
ncbi:unnamed protein product [Lactuca saligna]|uniref:Uncharacterized protein n=1 Tax=Lactuca saligna TaxID=75948 RepID=A0AA35YI38_LACSI|nr:unnamed protein product [Lactuca saligna]